MTAREEDVGTTETQPDPRRRVIDRTLTVLGLTALAVAIAWLLVAAIDVFLLAFAGVLLAVFLNTPANFIASRTKVPHGAAIAIVLVVLLALVAGGVWLIGPRLATQAQQLIEELPAGIEQVRTFVAQQPGGQWVLDRLSGGGGADGSIVSGVTSTASVLLNGFSSLVLVLFLGIFLAAAPKTYRNGVVRLFPVPRRDRAREVMDELGSTLQGWLLGQLVAMVFVAVVTTVGLGIIGIPLALALGIFAGLFEFVPIVGSVVGFLPAALLALTQGGNALLWVAVLFLVIQQVEGNLIVPLVQRRTVNMPPALTIAAVFLGGAAFGPIGLLIATPLTALIMVLVKRLYVEDALEARSAR